MLDDRSYMRPPEFEGGRQVVLTLLVVNVVVFVVECLFYGFTPGAGSHWFALSPEGLRHGYVWQLLTYQFMHANLMHLVFNCWAIYVFGLEVERALGRTRFLVLYFSSGVLGGLLQVMGGVLFASHMGGPVVGASAAAFGLTAAFASLYPERVLTMLIFFVLPVTMKAKFLLLFCATLALAGIAKPELMGGVAHAAHLGGMLMGMAFIRYGMDFSFENWKWGRQGSRSVKGEQKVTSPWGRNREEDLPPEEFLSKEVDPILDKISQKGIQSLTAQERKILESARERMGRR